MANIHILQKKVIHSMNDSVVGKIVEIGEAYERKEDALEDAQRLNAKMNENYMSSFEWYYMSSFEWSVKEVVLNG